MTNPEPMKPDECKQEISDNFKIDILMKEYESLRSEIFHRIDRRFAFLGLTGAVAAIALFKVDKYTVARVSILFASIFVLGAVWFHLGRLIQECSSRISEIEQQVNSLVGDELLVWETRRQNNLFHRVNRTLYGDHKKKRQRQLIGQYLFSICFLSSSG